MKHLSKSDFKVAQSCPTKLYYKKHQNPSLNEANDYLSLLADGGCMIGKLAQLLFPNGIEISSDREAQALAIQQTEKLLSENENITLFEAAITVNNQWVLIDVLEKKGEVFNLIEVKSKSYNSLDLEKAKRANKPYWLAGDFRSYLEDVAFQKKVLSEKFPQASIHAHLMMPDKTQKNEHEELMKWFVLEKKGRDTVVEFVGTEEDLSKLRKSNFMGLVCVDDEISQIMSEVSIKTAQYVQSIIQDQKIKTAISFTCRDCEYRVKNAQSGFVECWGSLAHAQPHILDLGQLGNVNRRKGYENSINDLIKEGRVALKEVPVEVVLNIEKPFQNDRPFFQLTQKEEFLLTGFIDKTKGIKFPLHFIDFETSQMALPFHAGMRPFQNVIFQWSCHTLYEDGRLEHKEWLNAKDFFPNIEFATTLKQCIGNKGTVLTWSSYENTQLKAVLETLNEKDGFAPELKKWLNQIIDIKGAKNNRILDMQKLALHYYFHPNMGGRTSIKVVLPSVLKSTQSETIKSWLREENLFEYSEKTGISDPYTLLDKKTSVETQKLNVQVKNGGDAMLAYREMLYGASRNDEKVREAYQEALRNYCKLDTLAMLIIWKHWMDLSEEGLKITTREQVIQNTKPTC
jgi:hypothetical protein